jgi:hypothetical protein
MTYVPSGCVSRRGRGGNSGSGTCPLPHFVYAVISLIAAGSAAAQDVAVLPFENRGPLELKPASELPPPSPEAFVIGGRPVDASNFRATLVATSVDGLCTASLVAPSVVLTAAHCVGHDQAITIVVTNGRKHSGTCQHPTGDAGYARDLSADFALCSISPNVELARYETINTDPVRVARTVPVSLTGYGCTGPGGGTDRVLRAGDAAIRSLPGEVVTRFEVNGPVVRAPNYFATRGKAAVCPGDSGGATYVDGDAEDRRILGVNSRVIYPLNESLISSTSTPAAVVFFKAWANARNVALCGVHPNAERCR